MDKQVVLEITTELLPEDPGDDSGWEEPVIVVRIYNSRLTETTRDRVLGIIENALGFDEPELTLREVEEPGPDEDEPD